ncbi:hypothetical protein AB1L30_22480 [Bremerella sp. JC817]|uniref:hypothetical protein n=1 Tax=Bremerella sp. JC817 TaxID=3231756 RepID=UPI0034589EB0
MHLTTAAILILSAVALDTAAPSRSEIDTRMQTELEALAKKADEVGLPAQAKTTRDWLIPAMGEANVLYLVPESDPLEPKSSAPQLEQFWYSKFRSLRNAYADALFEHARKLVDAEQGAASYQTLHEVLRNNPDHAEARRILGYANVNGAWRRPGVVTRAKQPRYEHPKLGWPARSYWQIDTPHFEILTNHSEAEGLKLGERLEVVYSAWEQMFFSFWSNPRQLASYFNGSTPSPVRKKFQVVLFKSRGEYVSYLEPVQPRIGITLGIYQFDDEKVYLFHSDDETAHATWHHEVSHQLFQEYRSASKDVGLNFNAWAVEGVAMYLESLRIFDGYMTLGGLDASRLQYARNRYFVGNFHMPLAEIVELGREKLQKREDISAIYSHSAGLTQYLLDGDERSLREPFIRTLYKMYQGNDIPLTLMQETGQEYPRIDAGYLSYLQVTDDEVLALPADGPTTDLSLCGATKLTNKALEHIGKFPQLRWLDLQVTNITDAGIPFLKDCQKLRDLCVASTSVTDASMATIGKLKGLEELDISGTRITDAGIAQLRGLSNLKVLRMAVTQVSDEGLLALARLKNLEMIDARQTKVTADGVARLKQSLPGVVVHQ